MRLAHFSSNFRSASRLRGLLTSADLYRDGYEWLQAIDNYEKYLSLAPDKFMIWIQLGNCARELSDFEKAGHAYARAISIKEDHADGHFQNGHLFKMMGRHSEARVCFERAHALDPSNIVISRELEAPAVSLPEEVETAPAIDERAICWLDITDLLEYTKGNVSLSGIQRVVAMLLAFEKAQMRICPVAPEYDLLNFFAVDIVHVRSLVEIFTSGDVDRRRIDRIITLIYDSRHKAWPAIGDSFVVAGAFWIFQSFDLAQMFRESGVHFGLFVHDLIQIKNPEYVHREATEVFERKLNEALNLVSFILTNSKFVASEMREFIDENLDRQIPVIAVPLATELGTPKGSVESISVEARHVAKKPYVLCVSTIEIRKNHKYLVAVWERLRRDFPGQIPDLVFVGKWGWAIDDFRNTVERRDYLGDWLHVLNAVSDVELAYLYDNCLLTAYVSYAEGFGLPVGESLAHGKPCITSSTTSMPEVGGRFARYVDPMNIEDGYKVFAETLNNPAGLACWTDDIVKNFKIRSWDSFCTEFFEAVHGFSQRPAVFERPRLAPGIIVYGHDEKSDGPVGSHLSFRTARSAGWHIVEDWGVWASRQFCSLNFRTPFAAGTEIIIYLKLQKPENVGGKVLAVITAGALQYRMNLGTAGRFSTLKGLVDEGGHVQIDIRSVGRFEKGHSRFLGLSAIAFCANDTADRLDLLERLLTAE